MLLVTFAAGFGPSHDRKEVTDLLWRASGRCTPTALYADAGYDLEAAHAFYRDGRGVSSFISPIPRGGWGTVASPHRATMTSLPACYGRRWHVESFISGLKRTTAKDLRARKQRPMLVEASLNVPAYALRRA